MRYAHRLRPWTTASGCPPSSAFAHNPAAATDRFINFFFFEKEKARKAATSRASGFPINAGVVRKVAVPEL